MHACMLKDTTESQTAQQIKTMTQKCNKKNFVLIQNCENIVQIYCRIL